MVQYLQVKSNGTIFTGLIQWYHIYRFNPMVPYLQVKSNGTIFTGLIQWYHIYIQTSCIWLNMWKLFNCIKEGLYLICLHMRLTHLV